MTLKSFKDIFATLSFGYRVGRPMLPGSVKNRRHYGMGLCSCIRAKSATHLPMYHGVAQCSLRSIIITGNPRNMQKYEQTIPLRFHYVRIIGGLLLPTNRTDASISLSLNHYRLNWRYFNNLTSAYHLLFHISQVSATVRAYFRFALYDNVGLCLETTLAHVSISGAFFSPASRGDADCCFLYRKKEGHKSWRVFFWGGGKQILLTSLASNSATLACNCRTKSVNSSPVKVSKCCLIMFLS